MITSEGQCRLYGAVEPWHGIICKMLTGGIFSKPAHRLKQQQRSLFLFFNYRSDLP